MSKNRWTKEEEVGLIKDIASGINIDVISQKNNRSTSAIELRLKKIIYENVSSGKNIDEISKILNIHVEKTRQYFYSYKDFKEKHMGIVDNVMVNKNKINNNNIIVANNNTEQHGGSHKEKSYKTKINIKLEKLELENKALKLMIENKNLTNKINNMISEGTIDKNIKKIIKKIRKI